MKAVQASTSDKHAVDKCSSSQADVTSPLATLKLKQPVVSQNVVEDNSNKTSVLAALTRAFVGTVVFIFKRPIRLFRPVKISTWAGIQAIAQERRQRVTPQFVRLLIKKEGWKFIPKHVLPPFLVNTLTGFTLFTVYTSSAHYLTTFFKKRLQDPSALDARVPSEFLEFSSRTPEKLLTPFLAGSLAGAAQSVISTPLDNARPLILNRQKHLASSLTRRTSPPLARHHRGIPFLNWYQILKAVLSGHVRFDNSGSKSAPSAKQRLVQASQTMRRGWSMLTLSLLKDSLGFGVFFFVFEIGRESAKLAAFRFDVFTSETQSSSLADQDRKEKRSTLGLVIQSLGILVAGGIAGWCFTLISRPFERARLAIWNGRIDWFEQEKSQAVHRSYSRRKLSSQKFETLRRKPLSRRQQSSIHQSQAFGHRRGKMATLRHAPLRQSRIQAASAKGTTAKNLSQVSHSHIPSIIQFIREAGRAHDGVIKFLFSAQPSVAGRLGSDVRPFVQSIGYAKSHPSSKALPRRKFTVRRRQEPPINLKLPWRVASKIFTFVPPYAIGFFAYALLEGDLKNYD